MNINLKSLLIFGLALQVSIANATVELKDIKFEETGIICAKMPVCPRARLLKYSDEWGGTTAPASPTCKVESPREFIGGDFSSRTECEETAIERNQAALDQCAWHWHCGCASSFAGMSEIQCFDSASKLATKLLKSCIDKQKAELKAALGDPSVQKVLSLVGKDKYLFEINASDYSLVYDETGQASEVLENPNLRPNFNAMAFNGKIRFMLNPVDLGKKQCHPVTSEHLTSWFQKAALNPKSSFDDLNKLMDKIEKDNKSLPLKYSMTMKLTLKPSLIKFSETDEGKLAELVLRLFNRTAKKVQTEESELIEAHQKTGSGYVKGKLLSPYAEPPAPPAPMLKPK